jgi:hypothetical protein
MSCGPSSGGAAVVVYRVGDGIGTLVNTGNAVFLDAFTSSGGAPTCSTALPIAASGNNHILVASGTATSEGFLTRSTDGRYIVLTGYDVAPGGSTSLTTTAAARVVGRVDGSGNIDTTTALTDFAVGNNPRSAASTDGTNLWVGGAAGGVRYATLGATASTQLSTTVTNIRQTAIFGSQLYVSDSSGSTVRLGAVGAGTPTTSGQTITNLSGFPVSGSPYGFYFADLDGNGTIETVYVADDAVGVTKYGLSGGTWTAEGTVGTGSDTYRGLTAIMSGGLASLYATRKNGTELVSLNDGSGAGGTFTGTWTAIATAATNTAFRGVAPAPSP